MNRSLGGRKDFGPSPSRRRFPATMLAVVALVSLGSPATATKPPEKIDGVGAPLRITPAALRMVPTTPPEALARVAMIPGSRQAEAWGIAFTQSLEPGYDKASPEGAVVFMRRIRRRPWTVEGPPLDASGHVANPSPRLTTLAMAPNGEGWAVGEQGVVVHRLPGKRWIVQAAAVSNQTLNGISLGSDGRGVYGYAVGAGLTFLKLDAGRWTTETAPTGAAGNGRTVPELIAVSVVDRDRAWAVAQQLPNTLSLWERANGVWTRKTTGYPIFDSPPAPIVSGSSVTVNQLAQASGVSADAHGVWVTGMMQPVDASQATGTQISTTKTRPFVIRYDAGTQKFRSWCPRIYQLSNSGVTQTIDVCDQPFPFAVGDLPSIQGFGNGEALAGGFGFFRFHGGVWEREPDVAGYIASGSFTSPSEGWVATPGSSFTGTGAASSNSLTAGHWTREAPPREALRRWPVPARAVLESLAVDPSDPRRAIAVGAEGTIVRAEPGTGADVMRSPRSQTLHGVAWPVRNEAWAVGEGGVILRYDGRSWREDRASRKVTTAALFAVAFASPDRGWAVGARGTILSYGSGAWRADPASGNVAGKAKLVSIAIAGSDAVAVGDKATLIVERGRGWVRDSSVAEMLFSPNDSGQLANLTAVAGLADGTVFVGGARGVLLERKPGGRFGFSSLPPVFGTIHTLALSRDARGRTVVYASVGARSSRVNTVGVGDPVGWLFAGVAGQWKPLSPGHVAGSDPSIDAPVKRDAVYAVVAGADGRGWAAGGFPSAPDDDGHNYTSTTGSLWRLDASGSPAGSPAEASASPRVPDGAVAFAFASDTSCASGLCGSALGFGSRGDTMMLGALSAIEPLARAGVVRFVALGGDLRRTGIPDELALTKRVMDEMGVPVYAALGDKDLFGGLNAGSQSVLASPGYALSTFADRPKPWGSSAPKPGFVPVVVPGEQAPAQGQARTHYAFDYAPGGTPLVRMVFLDTSRTPLATSTQNPPDTQESWLPSVLSGASAPVVVVMHQPLVAGLSTDPDSSTLTSLLTAGGVKAVLAGHVNLNQAAFVGASGVGFPAFTAGTSGAVLGGGWTPSKGAYNAWDLVVVSRAGAEVRSMPVLESVALSARDGHSTSTGRTLRFGALGRAPDAGSANAGGQSADGNELNASYLSLPWPRTCGALDNADRDGCAPANALRPSYRFACEDTRVCDFVREDPAKPGMPFRDAGGALVPDSQSGLMCAFNAGSTFARVEAGLVASRVPVTVSGGSGPCIPDTRPSIVPPFVAQPAPAPVVRPVPDRIEPPQQVLKPKTFDAAAIPGIAPPPVQPAPAPPGGGAPTYEEERESATEKAEMTALPVGRNAAPSPFAGVGIGLLVGSIMIAFARKAKPRARARHAFATAGIHRTTAIGRSARGAPEDR